MAKPAPSRGLRDEMNVGPDPRDARQLTPLRDLGKFQIAEGEPDVRGWTVYTSTGREIGRVHELLVDTDARQVATAVLATSCQIAGSRPAAYRRSNAIAVSIWIDGRSSGVAHRSASISTDDGSTSTASTTTCPTCTSIT